MQRMDERIYVGIRFTRFLMRYLYYSGMRQWSFTQRIANRYGRQLPLRLIAQHTLDTANGKAEHPFRTRGHFAAK